MRFSLAWSVPAAFCLVLGIALAAIGLPLWVSAACAGTLLLAGWLCGLRWLLFTVLLLPLGACRLELWEARPQPLVPLIGTTQTLSGQSDGTYLRLADPAGSSRRPPTLLGCGEETTSFWLHRFESSRTT